MSPESEFEHCRRCDAPIFDFCGTWLRISDESTDCDDGFNHHEPTSTEAERIGFTGYTSCPMPPCTGTLASMCLAAGDCAAEALLERMNRLTPTFPPDPAQEVNG